MTTKTTTAAAPAVGSLWRQGSTGLPTFVRITHVGPKVTKAELHIVAGRETYVSNHKVPTAALVADIAAGVFSQAEAVTL